MAKEIECPGENLEALLLYGNQIHSYNSFSGEQDPKKVDKKTINYYRMGKKLAKDFPNSDKGRKLFDSLKVHVEKCKECAKNIAELRNKYLDLEKLAKLTQESRENLFYCGILN